jgi:radical SAM protein with 4Fe4S-binding SPASM domain
VTDALVQLRHRSRRPDHARGEHPRYVVWELTLKCDQRCAHCGSRAADARDDELTTDEALDVVRQLAAAGTQEVTLIGGEAYLHPGFLAVARAIVAAGMRASMTTGGRALTAELAAQLAGAGMCSVAVSVDGLRATHDLVRARRGSFDDALAAIANVRATGLPVGCNTVVNRLNVDELEPLFETLLAAGVRGWQVQLVVPLGRAADRPDLLLQPWQLLDLVPRIARLKERAFAAGILLMPGNNVGYYSRDEKLLRSTEPGGRDHWRGCQAGRFVLGIEANGAVKGCPSLPTRGYVGGNLRDRSLAAIWDTPELAFARVRTVDDLWGFCRTCAFAENCLAGCTFTAHSLLGRPGNNVYCHYRAKTLAADGVRERLVPAERAPGEPFDYGRYDVVREPFDAPAPPQPQGLAALRVWRG